VIYQSRSSQYWKFTLVSALAIIGTFNFSKNCAFAQILEDNTLGSKSSVVTPQLINGQPTVKIDGGVISGSNLFHSFEQFSVEEGTTAYFNNATAIQNIITRVTGKSASTIDGILKANDGANLFLINPNGIIFGRNASLNIGGSFVASTAASLNFADGTKFSATDPQVPLLRVSVPIGLQFGPTANFILNQSQAPSSDGKTTNILKNPVGLQVPSGKTLALVGGDITLDGGNLTANSGRIELGSLTANSLVSLKLTNEVLSLGYADVQNFQNIRVIKRTDGSGIASQVDASGESGGNIEVRGNYVEIIGGNVLLTTQSSGSQIIANKNVGDLTISSRKLIVRDGAQVSTATNSTRDGGKLSVRASESVEVTGRFVNPNNNLRIPSALLSSTSGAGKAGDIEITTGRLLIQDGGRIRTNSTASSDGNSPPIAGTGNGGNLIVKASDSVELIGSSRGLATGLFALTDTSGDAGKISIDTGKLIVRGGATISVSSQLVDFFIYPEDVRNSGKAGDINITARSILLDQGTLTSNSQSGKGGNMALQVRDLLLMRRNSQISTNAGSDGDGGNITIKAPNGFIIAPIFGNSDITANANLGSGGKITITTKNIFGFVRRTGEEVARLDPTGEKDPNNLRTNDITAFSRQNSSLDGTVQINSPDVDPSKGLVELPVNLVDPSQQIAAGCGSGAKTARSSFNNIGRGGTTPDPTQPLMADAVLADWITLNPESENRANGMNNRVVVEKQQNTKSQKVNSVNEPSEIVEAQGWVTDANGNVVLVAQLPTATPQSSSLTAASCAAN
jgi:filamentous hemagglutinin family protein